MTEHVRRVEERRSSLLRGGCGDEVDAPLLYTDVVETVEA